MLVFFEYATFALVTFNYHFLILEIKGRKNMLRLELSITDNETLTGQSGRREGTGPSAKLKRLTDTLDSDCKRFCFLEAGGMFLEIEATRKVMWRMADSVPLRR